MMAKVEVRSSGSGKLNFLLFHKFLGVIYSPNLTISLGDSEIFLWAVRAVLEDDGFRLPSPRAADALKAADSLIQWSKLPANQAACFTFSRRFMQSLRQCLPSANSQAGWEMWGNFHKLRTSASSQTFWKDFLKLSTTCSPHPILYQYITDQMLKELIREHFPAV